jgi:peptide-methionine (R)-S-oxide reductase
MNYFFLSIVGCFSFTLALTTLNFKPFETSKSIVQIEDFVVDTIKPIRKSDKEWKELLSPQAYYILRKSGTERAFTGKLYAIKSKGTYICGGCKLPLFSSETKFNSGTGWPSFWQPINKKNVKQIEDFELGMVRTEIRCARCDGHIGHVFDDGPKPTGMRYCMNSEAMLFLPAEIKK